jgi:integrase
MLALERGHDCKEHLIVENNAWRGVSSPGTKQGDSRVVPIPPGLRAVLDAYATPLRGPLFPAPSGGVWQDSSFYRVVWYPAQRASGLLLRPHDFRHSFVSTCGRRALTLRIWRGRRGRRWRRRRTSTRIQTGTTFDLMREAVG